MFKKVFGLVVLASVLFSVNAFAKMSITDGRQTVTTAGTAVALSSSSVPFFEATVCAERDNTGFIALGTSPVAAAGTEEGTNLDAGECRTYSPWVRNEDGDLADIKVNSTVSGDGVTYEALYK